ncbi:ACP S-malonyltransferase [Parvularcula flava]|uniref:[acyl-carrier-protein] S-malonyltransferase n=1 Tax=Aquisalinus luteolus TaxID=1566827 RepID=A0A8J3A3S1_9PROT|nr:ACP S-malonyltransferase [Aquisalinus luteolus]NHK28931.1 ACP S-malonyltransferase [Aquisalinus luteolus]GGI00821.1 acyl carrier protein [Aquisalinus luteolus]
MTRKKAVIVCPGRGTYNAAELGYLARHHADKGDFIAMVDALREAEGQTPVSALDVAERFSLARHTSSENASPLIFACALADFMAIDREQYDIVAVTGNSMGWYLALTAGGALSHEEGARLVNTMGKIMQAEGRGGQVVYPVVDDDWQPVKEAADFIEASIGLAAAPGSQMNIHASIRLGGLMVLGADEKGMKYLGNRLPRDGRYPMQLANHAAFHTPLLSHVPPLAQEKLGAEMFAKPAIPLIDGKGNQWSPWSTDTTALHGYTLGAQIDTTYDFSKAIEVAAKEYAPDVFILLGPGTTMGAPVAQELIRHRWRGLTGKSAFKTRQGSDPLILSMGMEDQRKLVVG